MNDPRRILVLAIDAASPALLRQWAGDGTLPHIASLMAAGLVGATRGVTGFHIGSTWPSFYTAVNPAGHGIYWLEQLRAGTYDVRPLTAADFGRRKALWEILSDAGRRVVVLDVPLSRLSPRLNGVQVVEWRTHDVLFGMQTTPATLASRIARSVGAHPAPAPCDAPHRSLHQYRWLADQLVRGAAARARLTNQLLAETPWDFAIQVFNEAHCAGHQLWHFHDPAHPAFNAAVVQAAGDLLRTVYVAIDSAIGEILGRVDSDTTVMLLTLHGMSRYAGASRLLPDILQRLGLTTRPFAAPQPGPLSARERAVRLVRAQYRRLPQSIRRRLYDLRMRVRTDVFHVGSPLPIDPRRTRCFAVTMGPLIGGIRFNLVGREPHGTVVRGADSDALSAELAARLLELVDADTGRPLVRRVHRTAALYRGDHLDDLPDLLVEWDPDRALGSTATGSGHTATLRAKSPRTGAIEFTNDYCRSGEHTLDGLFVVRGPGVAPGQMHRIVSTLDLAPTLAALLGAEMTGVDGVVIPELAAY